MTSNGFATERERAILAPLNDQQREAVTRYDGPLLVIAGAGSGKTRVITHRIAYLVDVVGIPAYRILAVTFTNKAAQEMRGRVAALLASAGQPQMSAPLISTFHSFCVRLLRRDIDRLGRRYTRDFTIYDADDALRLVKSCLDDLGLDDRSLTPRAAYAEISTAKNRGLSPELYREMARHRDDSRNDLVAKLYDRYQGQLRAANAVDFDDLLVLAVALLNRDQEVRDYYNERFRYILVDEYQDTNQLQFSLVQLLTRKTQNLCVVGDEDQGIYAWRGADIGNILSFETHFPDAAIVRLEQNYRSTQNILDIAGGVIERNKQRKGKRLWTEQSRGEKAKFFEAIDAEDEARWVIGQARSLLDNDPEMRVAVLYRTNVQSRYFEEACRRFGVSYNMLGGFSFYQRAEIKDAVAYVKLALNRADAVGFARVVNTPRRGIGKQTLDTIARTAADINGSPFDAVDVLLGRQELPGRAHAGLVEFREVIDDLTSAAVEGSPAETVRMAVVRSGLKKALEDEGGPEAESRLMNLEELVNAAAEAEEAGDSLRDFIDRAALVSDADGYDPNAPLSLMTMHAAKGLEFPAVFVVGLEDRLFPHIRANVADYGGLEEERRLFYVAITRAKRFLFITCAERRRLYGEETASEPSMFLDELRRDLIEDVSLSRRTWLSQRASSDRPVVSGGSAHPDRRPRTSTYRGKTYDSAASIREFFKSRESTDRERPTSQSSVGAQPIRDSSTPMVGDRVRHPKYGVGLLLRRDGHGEEARLTVSFPGYGAKKFVAGHVKLEKVP